MKNLKKFLAVVLAVAMIASSMATAFAADDPLAEKYPEAALMRDLGILKGSTGVTEAYLQQKPVRIQAAILTLRLMGKEEDALAYSGLAHFEDKIADTYWAKNVMGYLKNNPAYGWYGDNQGKLNPESKIQKEEFAKVLLKAMGYDQGTHYEWSGVMHAYKAAGLTYLEDVDADGITMNDIAIAIDQALRTPVRGSTETLASKLAGLNEDFKAAALAKGLISEVTIASVVNPDLGSAGEGSVVYPPAQVLATMSDGSTKMVDVEWEAEKFDTSEAGEVTIKGTIEGFAAGATATLTVIAAEIVEVADVVFEDAYVGQEVVLPETVEATFSNGKVEEVAVVWDPAEVDTSEVAELTFTGTVEGYGEITATMNVVEDEIAEVDVEDITINEGEALELPEEVEATYKSGKVETVAVEWDTEAVDTAVAGTYEVVGTIGEEYEVTVNVEVKAVALDFELSADNLREVVVTFTKPAANLKADNFLVNGVKPVAVAVSADSKVVTLTASAKVAQMGSFEVKVLKAVGLAADVTKKLDNVGDFTIPAVENVVAIGNSFIQITFSEPMDKTSAEYLGYYTIDGAIYSAQNPVLSTNGRVVDIALNTRMPEGVRKFVISNNVKDEAGYGIVPVVHEIAVAADTSAPASAAVSGTPTQTTLKVQFNEPVFSAKAQFPGGSAVTGVADSADKTVWKFSFGAGNYIPANADITISLIDVTDFNGNKANLSVNVNIVPDLTRPVYVGYEQTAQTSVVFEFSKDVSNTVGSFKFKDKNGYEFTVSGPFTYPKKDGNDVKTKLTVTDARVNKDNGPYAVTISGIVDTTPLANAIIPVSFTGLTMADKSKPAMSSLTFAGNKLYLAFDKKLDVATALTATNYTMVKSNVASALPGSATIALAADGKTVVITFAAGTNIATTLDHLSVRGVKDSSLNAMDAASIALTAGDKTGTGLNVIGAAVTAKNTIQVEVSEAPDVIYPTDFVIKTADNKYALAATNATYKLSGGKHYIVLTVNYDLASDAKYQGSNINISLVGSPMTKNLYGDPIALAGVTTATDSFAPTATAVGSAYYTTAADTTTINVKLSEELAAAVNDPANAGNIVQAGQFMVTLNGKLVNATVKFITNTPANEDNAPLLQFVVATSGDMKGKTFNVKFVPQATANVVDANNNALGAFEFSGTVSYTAK